MCEGHKAEVFLRGVRCRAAGMFLQGKKSAKTEMGRNTIVLIMFIRLRVAELLRYSILPLFLLIPLCAISKSLPVNFV